MQDANLAVVSARLTVLERRVRWYQRLTLALGLGLGLGVSLAARTVPSVADVLQARRLEVVDEASKVGFTAYATAVGGDRKSTRLNSSHGYISYAVFCLKKKKNVLSHLIIEYRF